MKLKQRQFVGEETKHTVSGRMGSGQFEYEVENAEGYRKHVKVKGAQIEIDGGYEGNTKFALIEAKKETASDFNIRQLFYPYRVWKNKINKEIVPIFFTHSNDVLSFFMYTFEDERVFSSCTLVKQKDYIVAHDKITKYDIDVVAKNANQFVEEPEVPFPQADSFERVVDLLGLLFEADMSKDEVMLTLNEEGGRVMSLLYRLKYLTLAEKILEHHYRMG
ncbi:DUF6997 domain-containing protein [Aneurinibacillus migulanus]|nr:hypothetical protein [Aneurinibacillus migulanus]MCP1357221.1 hypothetical protein [Aneurinibacillus migulanus]